MLRVSSIEDMGIFVMTFAEFLVNLERILRGKFEKVHMI